MFPYIRPQDIADIVIMSFLVYQLYRWFKNTKALQVVIGLGFLGILYVITKNLGLFMTSWILQELGTVLFVLIVVIFQTEIRQALYKISLLRNLFGRQGNGSRLDLMELATTLFSLAAERTGAIIVFQRKEPLDEYLLHGVPIDGFFSSQLLASIFQDGTPLHDGAVVVRDGRIVQASCHLPLSTNPDLPQYYGTRHRAGVGLTERSDAVVAIVSEERGEVSLALGGRLLRIGTPEQLSGTLYELLAPPPQEEAKVSLRRRLFSNLRPKVAIVMLVIATWFMITAKQGGIVTLSVPLKFHNLPDDLVLVKTSPEDVEVQLKVISSLIPSPKRLDIAADLDLGKVREGPNLLAIKGDDLHLPPGMTFTGVTPSVVKVTAEKKMRKVLRVKVVTIGKLPGNLRLRKLKVDPPVVTAEGPDRLMAQFDAAETEAVDLSTFRANETVEKRVLAPAPQIKVLQDATVRVRIVTAAR